MLSVPILLVFLLISQICPSPRCLPPLLLLPPSPLFLPSCRWLSDLAPPHIIVSSPRLYLSPTSLLHQRTPHNCLSSSPSHYFCIIFYFLRHSKAQMFGCRQEVLHWAADHVKCVLVLSRSLSLWLFHTWLPPSNISPLPTLQSLIGRRGKSYSLFSQKKKKSAAGSRLSCKRHAWVDICCAACSCSNSPVF